MPKLTCVCVLVSDLLRPQAECFLAQGIRWLMLMFMSLQTRFKQKEQEKKPNTVIHLKEHLYFQKVFFLNIFKFVLFFYYFSFK